MNRTVDHVLQKMEDMNLDKDTFCVVPFINLILEPDGKVGVCREKGSKFIIGDLSQKSLEEIWNGEFIRKWRREFIEGKPSICSKEISHKKCNLCPQANTFLDLLNLSESQQSLPQKLTANFSGKCNLRCQMCDIWKLGAGYYDNNNLWTKLMEEMVPNLKEIDLLSGEPFIQKETYRLINEVSEINPECLWTFTTNAHFRLNATIKRALDKIKIKNLLISIDSFDTDLYAKIRPPGKLEMVLNCVEEFRKYENERMSSGRTSLNLKINYVVQKDNWQGVDALFNFCKERDLEPFLIFLSEPRKYSLLDCTREEVNEILAFYIEKLSFEELLKLQRVIRPLLGKVDPLDRIHFLEKINQMKE